MGGGVQSRPSGVMASRRQVRVMLLRGRSGMLARYGAERPVKSSAHRALGWSGTACCKSFTERVRMESGGQQRTGATSSRYRPRITLASRVVARVCRIGDRVRRRPFRRKCMSIPYNRFLPH